MYENAVVSLILAFDPQAGSLIHHIVLSYERVRMTVIEQLEKDPFRHRELHR